MNNQDSIEDRYLEDCAFSAVNCEFIELCKYINLKYADIYEIENKIGYVSSTTYKELEIIEDALELRLK